MGRGVARELALQRVTHRREGLGLDLVGLGEHDLIGNRRLIELGHDLAVAVLGAVARVDQQADPAQLRPAAQVAARQCAPLRDLGLGGARVAIAWQVDQNQPFAQVEEIELPGAPGRVRDSGQGLAPGQGVDQARLADVGAAGEGDLGQGGFGQALRLDRRA